MTVIMRGCSIEDCQGSGVHAYYADITCDNLQVVGCNNSGVGASDNATITLSGQGTSIQGNGMTGESDDYGLKAYSCISYIHLVLPLTKEQISTNNGVIGVDPALDSEGGSGGGGGSSSGHGSCGGGSGLWAAVSSWGKKLLGRSGGGGGGGTSSRERREREERERRRISRGTATSTTTATTSRGGGNWGGYVPNIKQISK